MYILHAEDVMSHLQKHDAVLIDARGGADAYQRYTAGHAAGAHFVDLETQLSEKSGNAANGGRHPLPDMKTFGSFLGSLGIAPDTHVIVYDDKGGANAAARFWWMLKAVGHKHVTVISGGLDALSKAGIPITSEIPGRPAHTAHYPVQESALPVVDIATIKDVAKNPDYLVIDVREGYRYRGESEPIDQIAGHIPGAVNIPYIANLGVDGKFLPASELAARYKEAIGSRKPERVIVHCGSGVTACHTLLAMKEAGIEGPKLYVGSWSEWSRNDYPIATGEKP